MAAIMAAIMEITENIMRRMREPSTKLHNALYFMSGMMVVILALVIVAGVKTKAENAGFHIADDTENSYEQQVAGQTDTTQDSGQEKWQEGVVAYQGKEYLYNTDIKTYLMMGVDIDGPVQQSSDYTQGGQSDALFLLVVNNKTEQLQVISINRNTMADIELCDEEGIDMGPLKTQICLQHAFGDGKRLSCSKTVDAVSGLFQNIPISGYLAMNMGGIPQMNDAVGGVEVTVLQDISFPKAGVDLKKGKKVTLDGTQAYYYLHVTLSISSARALDTLLYGCIKHLHNEFFHGIFIDMVLLIPFPVNRFSFHRFSGNRIHLVFRKTVIHQLLNHTCEIHTGYQIIGNRIVNFCHLIRVFCGYFF
jgi:polyisoprenyl-teichoic acid--peptidoglycan teichoic acid transferase